VEVEEVERDGEDESEGMSSVQPSVKIKPMQVGSEEDEESSFS
jgi:hypothetical protein